MLDKKIDKGRDEVRLSICCVFLNLLYLQHALPHILLTGKMWLSFKPGFKIAFILLSNMPAEDVHGHTLGEKQ
jgi:hypothetical protein